MAGARIAQAVRGQADDVVAHIDEAVSPVAEKVGPVILDRLIDEAMMRLYPEERELAQLGHSTHGMSRSTRSR